MINNDEKESKNKLPLKANRSHKRMRSAKYVIFIAIMLLVLAATIWKISNDRAAFHVVGVWYSEGEGLQYHFEEDKTFYTTNGQIKLIEGAWSADWTKNTLVLRYTLDDEARRIVSAYTLSADNNQLLLADINNRELTLRRLKVQ